MSIAIAFPGDSPLSFSAHAISGYHRPLGGEVAHVTVTTTPTALEPGWLAEPPLGAPCAVYVDNQTVLEGVLYSVRVTATTVDFGVEG